MEYKIVKINTDSICKTRNLFLDKFLNTNKSTRPCQTNQFLKEAIKNTKTKKSRATHPCQSNQLVKEVIKNIKSKKSRATHPCQINQYKKEGLQNIKSEKSRAAHPCRNSIEIKNENNI